jgi:flagellar biosynthetic protein FlhB
MSGERTEKATPKRRQDERKKGNIFYSREVVTVLTMLGVFYSLRILGPGAISAIQQSIVTFLNYTATLEHLTIADMNLVFFEVLKAFIFTALPLLLICGLISVVATALQTRMLFTMEAVRPKFSKLNPLGGLRRLFSLRSMVELLKSLIKIGVLIYIIFGTLNSEFLRLPRLMDMELTAAMAYTGEVIFSIVRTVAIIMAFVAAADYFYQWFDYERQLRMTKQEIKEEYKQIEGDPQIKGRIRERMQQQSRRRMMQNVPSADVVIRNPTHYAVAIKYDPEADIAPVVIAKGADSLALRIIEVAEEHGVIVTENRSLARGLYEAIELDNPIPERFYQPVAEVLAFVYSLKKKDMTP